MSSLSHRRGDLLARGNTSDVWSWGRSSVVKVLRRDIPPHWASLEAEIAGLVHEAGFAVPAVEEVVVVDGRPGIVFERIDGISMWEQMLGAPTDVRRLTRALVDLQCELHSSSAPAGLPDLRTRLWVNISRANLLTDRDREEAARLIERLPSGTALCHGDMHPRNILMSSRGMTLIDWFDASAGNPVADIARSSLLIRPQRSGELRMHHLRGASIELLRVLHGEYMSQILSRRSIDEHDFMSWEAAVAAARLAEPVPKGDPLRVWKAWREGGNIPDESALIAASRRAQVLQTRPPSTDHQTA